MTHRKTKSLEERFLSKIVKGENCWSWHGPKDRPNGYGQIHMLCDGKRRTLKAHRVSWMIHKGPIPDGLWVLHKCDNPECTNPEHLFLGNRSENMLDCAAKGRLRTVGQANKTHCKRGGHEFTPENTYLTKQGWRKCIICVKESTKRNQRKTKRELAQEAAASRSAE